MQSLASPAAMSAQRCSAEVGGRAVCIAENAVFLDLGNIIFDNTVRDVSVSAVNAHAICNLEAYCSCAKTVVRLLFLFEEA